MKANKYLLSCALVFSFLVSIYFVTTSAEQQATPEIAVADRFAEVGKSRQMFGGKFIVLPKAMYGDRESAIHQYQRLTEARKAEKRASAMELP